MIKESPVEKRNTKKIAIEAELTVIGGGLAGVCCAVTAARKGVKVVIVQDRPVLGGNSSSEVRLWVLGATSHMGNNNRWAREGGVINEILIENVYRNRESNPLIFDTILLEKVIEEENITLLLNTAVFEVEKKSADEIKSVRAFCSQNSTEYNIGAPLFCDSSGDGIVAFLAGAAFRMGAEAEDEFGEKFAPSKEYGELLGHSMYFYTKDTQQPVKYIAPSFALKDITRIPHYRKFAVKDQGCNLWWLEYGGRLDTIHDTEKIKWELWKVVYGVWNHIKNSGQFPEAENMTLEWVATIPGKRESRRFEGDYILKQQDIIEQTPFEDTVAFGGWSIDLHPADGVFSEKPSCNQWHSKGIYGIPYRCYYSKNVSNLFVAGRIISATHVAFGSSRVMATCAHGAQAIGIAAYLGKKHQANPREIGKAHLKELQLELLKSGQHLPGFTLQDQDDLVLSANNIVATALKLNNIPPSALWKPIAHAVAQMLPISKGKMPNLVIKADARANTSLVIQLRKSSKPENHTPDVILETKEIKLVQGENTVELLFDTYFDQSCYAFVTFLENELVSLNYSEKLITGLLSVVNSTNPAVSNFGKQEPTTDIGVETFEFWCPQRRPSGQNIAMCIFPPLEVFDAENLRNGLQRPVSAPNAFVAALEAEEANICINWDNAVDVSQIVLSFDCDYDHPMENVLMRHAEAIQPFCVTDLEIIANGKTIATVSDHHQAQLIINLEDSVNTKELQINLKNTNSTAAIALFEIRCY